jgi:exopolysaccharide biosynthesis protein
MILGSCHPTVRRTIAVLGTLALCGLARAAQSVAHEVRRVHGVTAHVVTVNLNDPRVRVSVTTPSRGFGSSEPFGSFIRRTLPSAAITGTFFSTRSLLPVGDIVTKGRTRYRGPAGTAVCFTEDNGVKFQARKWGRTYDWSEYQTVLCTGPTLLRRGLPALYPRAEGYRDPSLFALRPRTALGVTRHNKLLLVAVNRPVHLRTMMGVLRDLGAVEAAGLDGGSSSALYANGRVLVSPGRRLVNVLTVTRSRVAPTLMAVAVSLPSISAAKPVSGPAVNPK